MDHAAVRVAEHLHLDMARPFDVAFDVEPPVTEVALSFGTRARYFAVERTRLAHDPHPLATAAGRRLDQERKSDPGGARRETRGVVIFDRRGRHRKTATLDEAARPHLVTHQVDRFRGRPDKDQARIRHAVRKSGVFGKKAIPRMDCVGLGFRGRAQNFIRVEIGAHGRRTANRNREVGGRDRRRVAVGRVVNHRASESHRLHGAQHAHRDLPAIGDQHGAKRPGHR